jgi:hypothetical protein
MLKLAGENCERIMGKLIVNVPVSDVQCDEIWGFVGKKEAHKMPAEANDESIGDAYCFVAVERNTKLVLSTSPWAAAAKPLRMRLSKACALRPRHNGFKSARTDFSPIFRQS